MNTKKKITVILFCLLSLHVMSKSEKESIKQGLYYGASWNFTPQPFVYVMINNDTAFVDCLYPFKGQFSYLFRDTLTRNNSKDIGFSSKKNNIYYKRGSLYFKCPFHEQMYRFKDLKLQYKPNDINRYNELRNIYNYENILDNVSD